MNFQIHQPIKHRIKRQRSTPKKHPHNKFNTYKPIQLFTIHDNNPLYHKLPDKPKQQSLTSYCQTLSQHHDATIYTFTHKHTYFRKYINPIKEFTTSHTTTNIFYLQLTAPTKTPHIHKYKKNKCIKCDNKKSNYFTFKQNYKATNKKKSLLYIENFPSNKNYYRGQNNLTYLNQYNELHMPDYHRHTKSNKQHNRCPHQPYRII